MNQGVNSLEGNRKSGVNEESFIGVAMFHEIDEKTEAQDDQIELLRRRHVLRRMEDHVKHRRNEIDWGGRERGR